MTDRTLDVVIVVPVFGHSVVAIEAVCSAISQNSPVLTAHTVVVLDGEADEGLVCFLQLLSVKHKGDISVLWRSNGGLSAARNTGVAFALNHLRPFEAFYFLDADNRLSHGALTSGFALLSQVGVDFVYPDIREFGMVSAQDAGGQFRISDLATANFIEAGSLVRRRVFESGLWFDETLRSGFEDWDFWISATLNGFRGAHDEKLGLQYRKRPESMLARTSRSVNLVKSVVTGKHPDLFSARPLAKISAAERPLFEIVCVDLNARAEYGGVPLLDKAEGLDQLSRQYLIARAAPGKVSFPEFLVFSTTSTAQRLSKFQFIHGFVRGLGRKVVVNITIARSIENVVRLIELERPQPSAMVIISREAIAEGLAQNTNNLFGGISYLLEIPDWNGGDVAEDVAEFGPRFFEALKSSPFYECSLVAWSWQSLMAARGSFDQDAGHPKFRFYGDGPQVGVVVPNDVEAIESLSSIAIKLRQRGCSLHLFAYGGEAAKEVYGLPWTSINFLHSFPPPPISEAGRFFGTKIGVQYASAEFEFGALTALFDWGVGISLSSAGMLRQLGVKVAAFVPNTLDTDLRRRRKFNILAFEDALDLVVVEGAQEARSFHGSGIPNIKLVSLSQADAIPVLLHRMSLIEG